MRKDLIEGKPIDHHAPWKKHYRLNSIIALLFTVVVGLSAILPFVQLVKSDTKTLPEASPDLPIVRLADVEQNPALVRGESSYIRTMLIGATGIRMIGVCWHQFNMNQMKTGLFPEKCGRMGAANIHQVFIQGFIS